MEQSPYLSVIIPVYNESSRKGVELRSNFENIENYLRQKNITYEIVVVNDGSSDDSVDKIKSFAKYLEHIIIIDRKENKGKWFSVREGLAKASGKYRLFTDADGSTSIDNLEKFWSVLSTDQNHIVIGSRDMVDSRIEKHQPKWKELLGSWGSVLTRTVVGLPEIKDTQCGFKVLSKDVCEVILPQMVIDRWGGDFELLALSNEFGYKIVEIPVVWVDTGKSLVGLKGYVNTLFDLFKVKWRLVSGKYKK